jgi:hypothetical protein
MVVLLIDLIKTSPLQQDEGAFVVPPAFANFRFSEAASISR